MHTRSQEVSETRLETDACLSNQMDRAEMIIATHHIVEMIMGAIAS